MEGQNDFRNIPYAGAFLAARTYYNQSLQLFLNCQENLDSSKRRKPKGLATTVLVESGSSEIPTYHSKNLKALEKNTAKLLKTKHK